jgi:hypothetical protein
VWKVGSAAPKPALGDRSLDEILKLLGELLVVLGFFQ